MEYYIYLHINLTTNKIFYIGKGKGKGNRAYSKESRNKYWHNVVNKYGYYVLIYKDNLTEKEALKLEKNLIEKLKNKYRLVNLTDGGEGISGYKYTEKQKNKMKRIFAKRLKNNEHPRMDKVIYEFKNTNGDYFKGTRLEFSKHSNLEASFVARLVNKKTKTLHGWYLKGIDIEPIERDKTKYNLYNHFTKQEEFLTSREFRRKYNCSSGCFYIIKKGNSWKGWTLNGVELRKSGFGDKEFRKKHLKKGNKHPRADKTIYTFKKDNVIEKMTKYDFRDKYNLDLKMISKLVRGGNKSYKGWSII